MNTRTCETCKYSNPSINFEMYICEDCYGADNHPNYTPIPNHIAEAGKMITEEQAKQQAIEFHKMLAKKGITCTTATLSEQYDQWKEKGK